MSPWLPALLPLSIGLDHDDLTERSTVWLFSETLIRSGYGPLTPTRSILPLPRATRTQLVLLLLLCQFWSCCNLRSHATEHATKPDTVHRITIHNKCPAITTPISDRAHNPCPAKRSSSSAGSHAARATYILPLAAPHLDLSFGSCFCKLRSFRCISIVESNSNGRTMTVRGRRRFISAASIRLDRDEMNGGKQRQRAWF